MTKLEELIRELCPKGVQYKTLKEILTIKNGSDYKHLGAGNVPVYGSGGIMTYVDCYVYDKPSVLIPRKGSVDKLYFVEEPFWNVDTIFYTDIDISQAMPKYVYYCLQMEHLEQYNAAGGVPSLTQAVLNKVKIPVPPLPVQREIVRILDKFTELTAELTAELTKELAARKKQYGYYRKHLLNNVGEKMSLKSISKKSCSGGTPLKSNNNYYTNGTIPWLRTQEVVFNDIYKTDCFITELAVKETSAKWIPANCVIVAISGASAGRCAVNKIPLTTNQHCLNIEINSEIALYKYVFHCICSQYEELIAKKEGARGDLNAARILSLEIPVPPIEEQKRIVAVLDRFGAICNDITSKLSAEIEARQKQYEYYRDKLLAFQEVKA